MGGVVYLVCCGGVDGIVAVGCGGSLRFVDVVGEFFMVMDVVFGLLGGVGAEISFVVVSKFVLTYWFLVVL